MVPKIGKAPVTIATLVGLLTLVLGYFEGSRPVGYYDPLGIPTACIGHTGPEVVVGHRYTSRECLAFLEADIQIAGHAVSKNVKVPLEPWEFLAYTDFVFNMGEGSFKTSTMLRLLNMGKHVEACNELPKWVWGRDRHGTRIKLPGLVKRREFEKELCLGHDVTLGS